MGLGRRSPRLGSGAAGARAPPPAGAARQSRRGRERRGARRRTGWATWPADALAVHGSARHRALPRPGRIHGRRDRAAPGVPGADAGRQPGARVHLGAHGRLSGRRSWRRGAPGGAPRARGLSWRAVMPWAFTYRAFPTPPPELVAFQEAQARAGRVAPLRGGVSAAGRRLPRARPPRRAAAAAHPDAAAGRRGRHPHAAALRPRGRRLARAAARCRCCRPPGTRCFLETPKAFADRVLRFLARHRLPA